jgi:glyoxylase-like metal-dependent hydrolase (beta-lactamase superfamily II)
MQTTYHDVRIVPNAGWDQRILLFQYKRIVTNFAVISERYVVLIDTLVNPATAEVMVDATRDALRNGRQLLVINTHADWDHYWGNAAFAGPGAHHPAPIIGHRLCRARVLAPESQAYLEEMQRTDRQTCADVRLEPPSLTFDGPFAISGGDLTLELIHTPGHKPDHISVFIPEIRTLFPGDAAEDPLPFVRDAAGLVDMRASFERMLALDPATVLYCHAPGSYGPEVIRANIAYFNEIERRAAAALAAGRVPEQLDTTSDVEALVDYPFAEVEHIEGLDAEEYAFYLGGHRDALRATLDYLRQQARAANP